MSAAILLGAALVPLQADSLGAEQRAPASSRVAADALGLRPLSTSADHRIVDDLGRDVLLRGANVNSLGEYWQGVASLSPTIDMTAADWDAMASHGFSVVRLLITWSRVEPERGVIDQSYLDQVDAYVAAAAERGIYTVIDMHQDAYSAFISTDDPATCAVGTEPAKGWDGAPEWATLTDGLSTCITGDRNSSPAVNRAWNNFYDNKDGIRDQFVQAWKAVAVRFAGRPEVAGYDLLNEPEASRPAAEMTPLYEDLIRVTVTGIRDAERTAGATRSHILIVEPALPAGDPSRGLVIPDPGAIGIGTENVVASVHNYAESISVPSLDFTIEGLNDVILGAAAGLGVPAWGGEYGFWDTSPETLTKARRYAADEDANALGGAWWQWRQSCGDPHAVQWRGGSVVAPTEPQVHLNVLECPANRDLGPNTDFLTVLGRAFPRATPGRITTLRSDPTTGFMNLQATAGAGDVGRELVVWTPTTDDRRHPVSSVGLTGVSQQEVPGGRLIVGRVSAPGLYALDIGPRPALPTGGATPGAPSAPRPPAATPRPARPAYTG